MVQLPRTDRRRLLIRNAVLAGTLMAAVVFLFLPVEMTFHMDLQGRILPEREWMVTRDPGGQLTAILYDHLNGVTDSYSASQFDREDAVRFSLWPGVRGARSLAQGDTIGMAVSNQVDQQLAVLRGELTTERATLDLYLSGEKASVVDEARQRIRYAEEQVAGQRKVVSRLRTLTERNAASEADLEIEESRLALYEANIDIAKAALNTVTTGARPEEIQLVRARIASLESQIEALGRRVRDFTLVTPISGIVIPTGSMDTLLVVADTSGLVVMIPVEIAERQYILPDQSLYVKTTGGASFHGRILRVEHLARRINGRQVVVATGILDSGVRGPFIPGMRVTVRIQGDPVTPRERLRRWVMSPAGAS